jgi:uncharacterized membrane protein YkoI
MSAFPFSVFRLRSASDGDPPIVDYWPECELNATRVQAWVSDSGSIQEPTGTLGPAASKSQQTRLHKQGESRMNRRTKFVLAGAIVTAFAVAGGTGVAVAAGGDDGSETPITGGALEHASAVALQSTGGGRVTGTEVGDEDGYYEVEVTLADGRQVDVHLDRSFNVLITKADQEHPTTAAPDRALIAKQRAGETEAFGQPASR